MKPPYQITSKILQLTSSISEKIGKVNATFLTVPPTNLRKQNRIKTIHASLQIEGNTLSEEQITALLENKRVIGPEKDIQEVLNAVEVYDRLATYKAHSEKSFLSAHKQLLNKLIEGSGMYRKKDVGVIHGSQVTHLAPPPSSVPQAMKELFAYLKNDDDLILIKSCVFHYEMEFIHPFMDGNGRMGRLWQTVILLNKYPVFAYLPFEILVSKTQKEYYKALSISDKTGQSTIFIEYILNVIDESLKELLESENIPNTPVTRLENFLSIRKFEFSRKDYLAHFKTISSATASRDLKMGVENGKLTKTGDKNNTLYHST
ncbi:MAG: Fic family protein [Spirosomataceae bacterium]